METIELTILKEDILLDNYFDQERCPITSALHRQGYNDLIDCGQIEGKLNGDPVLLSCDDDNEDFNQSYKDLLDRLYGMYSSFSKDIKDHQPIPVETFTHTLIF